MVLTEVPRKFLTRVPPVQSRDFVSLQFRAGFKYINMLNKCTWSARVSGMFYRGSLNQKG